MTVSYTVQDINPIRDEASNNAPAFSGVAVANNSDPRPEPVVDGTPSVTGSQLVITYELELDPDPPRRRPITPSQSPVHP